jgi:hypothetical protein
MLVLELTAMADKSVAQVFAALFKKRLAEQLAKA